MTIRLYHLIVRTKNGNLVFLTRYPMPHDQCMVMKRKFTTPSRIELMGATV